MDRRTMVIGRCLLLACLTSTGILVSQTKVSIGTQQTTLQMEAGEEAPRVVSLRSGEVAAWMNTVSETLIESAEVDGHSMPLKWKLDRAASHSDSHRVAFVYESALPHLRLTWEWKARAGTGPVEHTVHIENLESKELWIPLEDSFRFRWKVAHRVGLSHLYIDKGAGKPSAVGTHEEDIGEGYEWTGVSSTYAMDGGPREIIPWFMVQRAGSQQDGWYVGVEFSGRTRLTLTRGVNSIWGSAGLNPEPGPFRTRLLPGGSFDTPTIFVGGFRGGVDELGNVLRPWVRKVLSNPATWQDLRYPLLVSNSWGSGMQVDEELCRRMIHDSADLGLEMFHVDAGWFRGVGDWYPDRNKFPHGLAAISEESHRQGLKFGMWVNWAEAGISNEAGALSVNNAKTKDWLVEDVPQGWAPKEFTGKTVDLGMPDVEEYASQEVLRIVNDYHLDMLEHDGYVVAKNCARSDHPHAQRTSAQTATGDGRGLEMVDSSNSTDVSYHAARAYYEIYSRLRKQHPDILLEICNDGGRMVDFGSASHGDYFSITDSYDPLSNRQAFFDASHILPAAMLEDYEMEWPAPTIESFRSMLRSGMMGWATIMQNTNAWSAEQHAAAKAEFELYKRDLRPLIRDADLYHISPRPDGIQWDAIEYFDRSRGRGVIYAFRGAAAHEEENVFILRGLRADRDYRLRSMDDSSQDRTANGAELLKSGVKIMLPLINSSAIVELEELPTAKQ